MWSSAGGTPLKQRQFVTGATFKSTPHIESGSDLGFPCRPSQIVVRLKCWLTCTPSSLVYPQTRPCCEGRFSPGTVSGHHPETAKCPEPLCPRSVLPPWGRRLAPPRRTLLLLLHSYGLMRQTFALLPPLALPRASGLCRLLPAPAGQRFFPMLSLRVFPKMPGLLPRRFAGCSYLLLPRQHRPSPKGDGSAIRVVPPQRLPGGASFSQLRSFLYVQASQFACHPGRSHHCSLLQSGQ